MSDAAPDPTPPTADDTLVLDVDCQQCPALVESRDCIAWGNGPRDAAVLVVGEAPAAGDPDDSTWPGGNRSGLAYTSRHSGRRIRSLLASVGLVDRAFYTNAVKCFPSDGEGSNREPTATERANCRSHLRREIDLVAPTVVLPTGKHATASLFSLTDRELDGFLDHVLDPVDLPAIDPVVIPLLHPSYADVWRSRLGYDRERYREALATALRDCGLDATSPSPGRF
ncbi:uracil-DNA glycosylase [Haloplanus halobius]|uniref:uracil-DNA glycosylase n=1 Tax=Haloplanus halobius TaxID=2934938 RepID=UPI0020106D62|nr:uracil-DNA glycosylase family protein [Haloplanus sp. XH21]